MTVPAKDIASRQANDRYRRVIENINSLPSLPSIVTRLIQIVNSPDTSADDATKLIEKDPGLTSKFIRLANSAFYGMPRSVSSVSGAVVILGFNVIRSVVLSTSVMKMFSGAERQAINKEAFWKHSIATALAAKEIVRHLMNVKLFDPESAFCAGILHDISKLIFNEYIFEDYAETCVFARKNKIPLIDAETLVLGINHAEIGRILADKWALPLDLEYALVHHHHPAQAGEITDLVAIVHLADIIAHDIGANLWEDEVRNPEWSQCRSQLLIEGPGYDRLKGNTMDVMAGSVDFLSIIK
jgi:putative nucleotidyltransferase with HDIG domain